MSVRIVTDSTCDLPARQFPDTAFVSYRSISMWVNRVFWMASTSRAKNFTRGCRHFQSTPQQQCHRRKNFAPYMMPSLMKAQPRFYQSTSPSR